jgi:hypothetical protein
MKGLTSKVLKFILFVLFIILADKFIGGILEAVYKSSDDLIISKIRYTLNKTYEDILIFGSSRAQHHYVSDTISKVTGRSVYNCGIGGQGLTFSFIQISETLRRYNPQAIILDVSPNIRFAKDSDPRLKILGPYYHDKALIRRILAENGPEFERLKYASSIYPYNGMLYDLLLGLVYSSDVGSKGYIPIYGTLDTNFIPVESSGNNHEVPSKQMDVLQEITSLCKQHRVDFWIIVSPVYKITKEDLKIIQDLEIFTKQQGIHFLDFSQNPDFSDHLLFKDNLHLNSRGAIKYSRDVGDSIALSQKELSH